MPGPGSCVPFGRRSLTAIALLAVSGCTGCPSLSPPFAEDDTPIESWADADEAEEAEEEGVGGGDRLRIVPDQVHVAPGAVFTLRVRAWDASGRRVALPAAISWSSTAAGVTFSGTDPVTVTLPVTVPPGEVTVVATGGALSSAPAKVIVSAGTGDRIELPHVAGEAPEAAILDAGEGANCVRDHTVMVVAKADLGTNFVPGCSEPPEVGLFSSSAGGQFEPGLSFAAGTVPPWTAASGDLLSRTALSTTRTVQVFLRVRTDNSGSDGDAAKLHIESVASGIYRSARAGVVFSVADRVDGGVASVSTAICNAPSTLAGYGVDVTLTRLYVLVVKSLTGSPGLVGWTCDVPAGQNGQVILVQALRDPTTLAHEFGHALGINKPIGMSGHAGSDTFNMEGFEYPNLMWSSVDDTYVVPRRDLTLGQVFRMNVHDGSWLSRLSGAGPTKTCQCKHDTSDVCPALHLDVPGTLSPAGNKLVCGV